MVGGHSRVTPRKPFMGHACFYRRKKKNPIDNPRFVKTLSTGRSPRIPASFRTPLVEKSLNQARCLPLNFESCSSVLFLVLQCVHEEGSSLCMDKNVKLTPRQSKFWTRGGKQPPRKGKGGHVFF